MRKASPALQACLLFPPLLPLQLQKLGGTASLHWAKKWWYFCAADLSLTWLSLSVLSNHKQKLCMLVLTFFKESLKIVTAILFSNSKPIEMMYLHDFSTLCLSFFFYLKYSHTKIAVCTKSKMNESKDPILNYGVDIFNIIMVFYASYKRSVLWLKPKILPVT